MAENVQSDDTHSLLQGLVREQLGLVKLSMSEVPNAYEPPAQFTPAGPVSQEEINR